MDSPRHDPIIAFLVGMAGIATFSAMDAVMKGLVLAIGTYTTLDAAGARRSNGFGYGGALFLGAGILLTVVLLATHRGPRIAPALRSEWQRFVIGGAAAAMAYSMVLAAVRLAPVGYVAALRESSVVLAAGAGWLFLHERMGRARILSSAAVATGLVLLIVWR